MTDDIADASGRQGLGLSDARNMRRDRCRLTATHGTLLVNGARVG